MKPAWDELGQMYKDSSSVNIVDVDCTEQSDLCQQHGVSGYPTIKYYTPENGREGEKYAGGRDIESLKTFVADNLEGKCDITDLEGSCGEKEQKFYAKFSAKSSDEQKNEQDRLNRMKDSKMKPDQKKFLFQRLNILEQLLA